MSLCALGLNVNQFAISSHTTLNSGNTGAKKLFCEYELTCEYEFQCYQVQILVSQRIMMKTA